MIHAQNKYLRYQCKNIQIILAVEMTNGSQRFRSCLYPDQQVSLSLSQGCLVLIINLLTINVHLIMFSFYDPFIY